MSRTLFDKIWDAHVVSEEADGTTLLYVDRQIVYEVTSPQAFEGLRLRKIGVRRPAATLAVSDHNVPTTDRRGGAAGIVDPDSRLQVQTLEANAREFGIRYFGLNDPRQGIVHIIGPEQGFTLPGSTIVCGDSHTSTHGAFGALAFGVGTSEVEHVLATSTLITRRPKTYRISVDGELASGVYAKDVILAIIGEIGVAGGNGHAVEYAGSTMRALSMEGRMTVCNMSVEAGARVGLVAPDEKTFAYLEGRPDAPAGDAREAALTQWKTLRTAADASFDRQTALDVSTLAPQVTWGTTPEDVVPITGAVPDPRAANDEEARTRHQRALSYMGLTAGKRLEDVALDHVFIGSCTNARIEDLRAAAAVARGRRVASGVTALVVPGSGLVKRQAEDEELDRIFTEAGFSWREPGCSMCLGMNPDRLGAGERCASTSNRNFEGRQGRGGRTHLVSPATAAASAIAGRLADVRQLHSRG